MLRRPPHLVLLLQLLVMLTAFLAPVLASPLLEDCPAGHAIADASCGESPDTEDANGDEPVAATRTLVGSRAAGGIAAVPQAPWRDRARPESSTSEPRGPPLG